jgi:hypothetical protein
MSNLFSIRRLGLHNLGLRRKRPTLNVERPMFNERSDESGLAMTFSGHWTLEVERWTFSSKRAERLFWRGQDGAFPAVPMS